MSAIVTVAPPCVATTSPRASGRPAAMQEKLLMNKAAMSIDRDGFGIVLFSSEK
jgi:hypothetical protein